MSRADPLARQLLEAAFELHRCCLWLVIAADEPFLVRVPGEEHPLAASITGHAGKDFGVVFTRGESALREMVRIVSGTRHREEELEAMSLVTVTMSPPNGLARSLRGLIDAAGFSSRRESLAPVVLGKPPHGIARFPDPPVQRVVLDCLRAMVAAHDAGQLNARPLDVRRRRILQIVAEGEGPIVKARVESIQWPAPIANPERETLSSPPLDLDPAPDESWLSSPQHGGRRGFPSTLWEWRQADLALKHRLLDEVTEADALTKRVLARYFGSFHVAEEVLEELGDMQPIASVVEWFYVDYRRTAKSPTFIEKRMEASAMTPTESALIEARRSARLSIYRVVSTQPVESLEVEDAFDGERFTLHGRASSGCHMHGTYLPLRIQTVADWNLVSLAGPPVPEVEIEFALGWLEEAGAELSANGLRRSAHLVGRLWELALERSQFQMQWSNTDGEEIALHTATFRMADADALVRALGQRKDVQYQQFEGAWVWSKHDDVLGAEEDVVLARLEMIDDRLVVDVDSTERLARAREWIEAVPGVTFERASKRDQIEEDGLLADALPNAFDEMTPERREEIEWTQTRLAWEWLDRPLPTLDGKSPRNAWKTAEGRRLVERLVRTMPDVIVSGGTWVPPREALLWELGIGR